MKTSHLILPVIFLLTSIYSFGQKNRQPSQNAGPVVTKGYYSIGSNSNKLSRGVRLFTDSVAVPEVSKGYYSIGANDRKLRRRPVLQFKQAPRPVITKGYYSIGNNNERK